MTTRVSSVPLRKILALRERYRAEMNCQIVHDSLHERGYLDSWLITVDDRVAGYGSVASSKEDETRTVREFFIEPGDRNRATELFRSLIQAAGANRIEAQTNDRLLTQMLLDCVESVERDRVLFEAGVPTKLTVPAATFRRIGRFERRTVFRHEIEPAGEWGIEIAGEIVATGGLMHHYNPPFADIYMEVAEPFRRRGIGSFLVQELKRTCREAGNVPAARCSHDNIASRRTLERAGMIATGWIIAGRIRKS